MTTLPSGRKVDTSCPLSNDCWANQGCWQACPETVLDVLRRTAALEHTNEMTPHTDPDVAACCEKGCIAP